MSSSSSSPMSSPQGSPSHSSKGSSSDTSSSSNVLFEYKSSTLPAKLDLKDIDWDELDDLLQVTIDCCSHVPIYNVSVVGHAVDLVSHLRT